MDTITPQQNFITSRLTFVNNNSNSSSNNNNRTRPYNISCVVKAFIAQQQQQQQQGINTNNNNNNQRQYSNSTGNGIRSFIRNNNNGDSNNNINSNNNSSVQGTALTTSTPQQTLIRNLNIINNIYNNQKNDIGGNNAVIANNIRQQQQQQQNQTSNLLIGGINNNGLLNRNINNLISNNNITNNNNNDKQFENGPILSERYLILKQLPGSSFYNCMDIKTGESLICKAIGNSYQKILNAYFRMDSFEHIKPLHKLLQTTSTDETYLLLPPSQYGDLHSFVRERKRLREPEARYLFRQICKTVKECHQQGIVLRDLKLRKFVFSDKERTHLKFESLEDAVVLDDYENDILKEKIGCPAYVAPEILKPNSDFSGKAADLWSLGVILYTMLVGRYPFNDPEHSSLFAKIARCTFTIPDFVSPKAKCLIKSLLQKVPKHRLTSDDLLDHQWLQSDSMITSNGGGYDSNSNNIGSFALASATNNYELSLDDHRVPDIESVEFT